MSGRNQKRSGLIDVRDRALREGSTLVTGFAVLKLVSTGPGRQWLLM